MEKQSTEGRRQESEFKWRLQVPSRMECYYFKFNERVMLGAELCRHIDRAGTLILETLEEKVPSIGSHDTHHSTPVTAKGGRS